MNSQPNLFPAIFKNPPGLREKLSKKPEKYWQKRGEKRVLELFKQMSERVPAYQDFLKKNKVKPELIKNIDDFSQIPTTSKDNYLRQYPLDKLSWDGTFNDKRLTISSTSGSTGEPFYFPRETGQDLQYAALAELYLLTNFSIDKQSTLYIVGFPLGPWIGGIFTYRAVKMVAERGEYALSVATPGINATEIINTVKKIGPYFDQIIIGSYGPFLKDTLDQGTKEGLDWSAYNCKFVFSAEVFSERFRDYVARKAGLSNIYLDTLNHYGTVDLGTMSYETPLAILSRRQALKSEKLFNRVFHHANRLPTLTQFIPELFYFESVENNLICSAFSGLPLVRYDLQDHGKVVGFEEMKEVFLSEGINLEEAAKQAIIADTVWNLPFVYVYERKDLSVSFYAFFIYPETIRNALQHEDLEVIVTSRFTMLVEDDDQNNPKLKIHVELQPEVVESEELKKTVEKKLTEKLLQDSSEFRETHQMIGERAKPEVTFWPHRDDKYFNPSIKQKWVLK